MREGCLKAGDRTYLPPSLLSQFIRLYLPDDRADVMLCGAIDRLDDGLFGEKGNLDGGT